MPNFKVYQVCFFASGLQADFSSNQASLYQQMASNRLPATALFDALVLFPSGMTLLQAWNLFNYTLHLFGCPVRTAIRANPTRSGGKIRGFWVERKPLGFLSTQIKNPPRPQVFSCIYMIDPFVGGFIQGGNGLQM
jgi:hypothetical protein